MYARTEDTTPYQRGSFARERAAAEEDARVRRGQAMRTVAGHAHDAQDLTSLLEMLGLEKADAAPAHVGPLTSP